MEEEDEELPGSGVLTRLEEASSTKPSEGGDKRRSERKKAGIKEESRPGKKLCVDPWAESSSRDTLQSLVVPNLSREVPTLNSMWRWVETCFGKNTASLLTHSFPAVVQNGLRLTTQIILRLQS